MFLTELSMILLTGPIFRSQRAISFLDVFLMLELGVQEIFVS